MDLLDLVGLSHAANRQVKTYSKGMRQRLGLAQAFLGQPKLLLLDEPTVGLDPIATKEFYQSVDALKQQGASIILCSHVLPGVEQHIDRAMILAKGEALALGSIDELREQAQLPITIETHGLHDDLSADAYLSPYVVAPNRLQVKQDNKLSVLKRLLDKNGMLDIHVEQANLEQLYQFYLGGEAISSQPIGAEL
jgi:Cu-processing system ATP-binding protein